VCRLTSSLHGGLASEPSTALGCFRATCGPRCMAQPGRDRFGLARLLMAPRELVGYEMHGELRGVNRDVVGRRAR
jgi:hypothetical protein